ncbi:hypothetical protein J4457_01905 [Candidatus Woesearchaeota archaeon]|nr:hypothetical protein [Candidatus Woesearchaeota archaeon]
MSEYSKRITEKVVQTLRDSLTPRLATGYYVMLSAGPGVNEKGAPGMSSAVALALCKKAVGPQYVRAVTFTLDGYTRPDWVAKAGAYAGQLGVIWETVDMTEEIAPYAKRMNMHPASAATSFRSLFAKELAHKLGYLSVAGWTLISSAFYAVDPINDAAKVAPVGNFDRSTTIAIGEELKIDGNILYQRPSNGAIEEGNRIMNRIFTQHNQWKLELSRTLDMFLLNLQSGKPVLERVPDSDDERIITAAGNAERAYNNLRGQLEVIMGENALPEDRENFLFGT